MGLILQQGFGIFTFLVLAPSLDVNVFQLGGAECIDECTRQTAVGNQWHVEVDGSTTNLVTIAPPTCGLHQAYPPSA